MTRPPEMMQPSEISESVAEPMRRSSALLKTNLAGAELPAEAEKIGQLSL